MAALGKGPHTGNVVFPSQSGEDDNSGSKISITEPFVRRFQYSQPIEELSLSPESLEERDCTLEERDLQ